MRTHSNFMHNQLLSPLLSKSRENNYMQQTARNLTSKSQNVGLRSTLILPPIINTTSLPSVHHIVTTNPKPLDWTLQSHNSMSSRHVKSFSTTRIDLLRYILVTFATSHWLRSPLKAEAPQNTVPRKEGRLHSQSTRKKRRRKDENPDQNTETDQRKQHILQTTYSTRFTIPNPPSQPPSITRPCSGHVTSPSNIPIDLMSCVLVTRITQLQHKPFCLPTHSHFRQHHPTYIRPPPTTLTITHKSTPRPINHRVHSISPHLSTSTSPPSLHPAKNAWNLIKKSPNGQTSMKSHMQSS
jgi:hypothetical protein